MLTNAHYYPKGLYWQINSTSVTHTYIYKNVGSIYWRTTQVYFRTYSSQKHAKIWDILDRNQENMKDMKNMKNNVNVFKKNVVFRVIQSFCRFSIRNNKICLFIIQNVIFSFILLRCEIYIDFTFFLFSVFTSYLPWSKNRFQSIRKSGNKDLWKKWANKISVRKTEAWSYTPKHWFFQLF